MKPMRLSLVALALVATMAACSSTSAGGGGTVDPADADVTVTAADMAFDQSTITVPGGGTVRIALVNTDSMPHNFAIYTDSSKSEKLYEGEMVTSGTIVYEIAGLEPGEYFFECSLHPTMIGTLVVEG